jgi:diguanylate cyclase (GGDEF)-like protein
MRTDEYVTLQLMSPGAPEAAPPGNAPPDAPAAKDAATTPEPALTVAEVASLLVHVRETVAMLTGEADAFSSGVSASTQRMSALMGLEDVRQMKSRLVDEIDSLAALAIERQERWSKTTATFVERIGTLETQLASSRREATQDPLTGIGNRRTLEAKLQEWLKASMRQFVVALIDLDDFKSINDSKGHPVGDRVLVELAQGIRSRIRGEDVLVRVGGDEFALLLPAVAPRVAENRLRILVRELPASLEQVAGGRVTVSCGFTEVAAGDTAASLLDRADRALYAAKRQGKNRVSAAAAPFIHRLMNAHR